MKISIMEKSCERCESVYSPAAYLLALTRFIDHYFSTPNNKKDMEYLFDRMQRSYLLDLPITCEEINKKIAQPKLVIKVLLNYIKDKTGFKYDEEVFQLLSESKNPTPFFYSAYQFKEYLHLLGTSLGEIHSIFLNSGEPSKEHLAEKMGISLAEYSLITKKSSWKTMSEVLLQDINEAIVSNAAKNDDANFFKEILSIRDKNKELDSVLDIIEGDFKDPFEFLLNSNFIGIDGKVTSINGLAFQKMFQFYILKNIVNMDIVDLLILLHQLNVEKFNYEVIEKVYYLSSMILSLDLTPSNLLKLKDKEFCFEKISSLLNINRETLENIIQILSISDITRIPELFKIWKYIDKLNQYDFSAENFFKLKISLVNFKTEPFTKYLGFTEDEILKAIESENVDNLIDVLGISNEEIEFLFAMGIHGPNNSDYIIKNPSDLKKGGLLSLELLHRPYRVANFLGLDLSEYQNVIRLVESEMILPAVIEDPNRISFEKILKALEIVIFIRKIGLNLREVSLIIEKCTDIPELKEIMGIDDEWWEDYKDNIKSRCEKLATQLNYSQNVIEKFICRQGASERHYVTQIKSSEEKTQNSVEISELSKDLDLPHDQIFYVVFVRGDISQDYKDWKLYNPYGDNYYTIIYSGNYHDYNVFLIDEEPKDLFIGYIVEIIKSETDISWIKTDNSSTLRKRTDIIRRWVALAQESNYELLQMFNHIIIYDLDFSIDILDHSYEVCLITIALFNLKDIIELFSWSRTTNINQFHTLEQVEKAYQILNLSNYLNLDLNTIKNLDIWESNINNEDVLKLYEILKDRFEQEQFESEIKKIEENLLEITRDSLLYYAISPNFLPNEDYIPRSIKDLSNELLIDLQVSKNVFTNEILQAIESLQTYIIRVQTEQEDIYAIRDSHFINFVNTLITKEDIMNTIIDDPTRGYGDQILDYGIGEVTAGNIVLKRQELGGRFKDIIEIESVEGVGIDKRKDMEYTYRSTSATQTRGEWWDKMEKDWKWMRRYILWEAAQKVFLFPENYVMPELRDNKSPFFEELEDELSQGEVTQPLAEKAISGYINKLQPISSIHVSGTIYDDKKELHHIFVRSQIDKKETYYRSFKNQRIWSSWSKIPIEINSDYLYPFLGNRRLYIFWIESEVEEDEGKKFKHKLCFAYSIDMKKWSKKRTIELVDPKTEDDLFTNKDSPWLGVYMADGINIYLNDKPPLFNRDYEFQPSHRLLLTCKDNIDFVSLDYPQRTRDFNFIDWEFDFPSDLNSDSESMSYFYKDKTSSQALIGYINERDSGKYWEGKATLSESESLMNFLFCEGTNLRILSSKYESFESIGFEDTFDDNTLNPKWNPEKNKGLIRERDGKLQFHTAGNVCDWWGRGHLWPWNIPIGYYDAPYVITPISENYENYWGAKVEISYPRYVHLSNHYGLILYKDEHNVWFFGHYNNLWQQEIRIEKIVGNNSTNNVKSVLFSPTFRHLRIERVGSTYYFDYSGDGKNWQNLYSISASELGFEPTHVGLFKKNWFFSYSNWAHFDNFSMYEVNPLTNISLIELYSKIIFDNIDSTFKIDNAIAIGKNAYFFCSDQYRCLIIIIHLHSGGNSITQSFSICQLNYGKYCEISDKLFREGLDAFYHPDLQIEDLTKVFSEIYNIPDNNLDIVQVPPPTLEFYGPNKIYNWELFFHIPYLIAESLNQNRKFETAVDWYHYIFNPYIKPDSSNIEEEGDELWKYRFKPFREEEEEDFYTYIYDQEDIDIWCNDPFNPHALARVRPYTYQKAIFLSYVENLLEWADQDFTQDTQETINAARIRYLFVEQLLDLDEYKEEIPQEEIKRTLRTMNEASIIETSSDLILTEFENLYNIPEDNRFRGTLPDDWIKMHESEIDPYSLKAMLINLKVGCIPENPIFKTLLYQLRSNLQKIRTGRNIAGIKRILPLFEASIDPMSVINAVASGSGLDNLNYSSASNVSPYRFVFLIERAKSLASLVMQAGNALLLAIERKETEELAFIKAQQELKLSKANVHLRKLGVIEANDNLKLAEKQTSRAQFIQNHYNILIQNGQNPFEKAALGFINMSTMMMQVSMGYQVAAAIASLIPGFIGPFPISGGQSISGYLGAIAGVYSTQASVFSNLSQTANMLAGFKRREEEWRFQKNLAVKDIAISQQNEVLAKDRIRIAEMEQNIAEMQAEFADATLEFLKEKFTNKELYKWMVKILSKILYGFYNLAYTAARMAQATMEFERNERYDFISYGYWDSEKKGLLSGDQLLLDIQTMDEAYIKNNTRKLEITKHISLARMAPEAIVKLKRDGWVRFATPMSWFDRDFPGHYQRIIKSVKFSLLALIGPGTNVNATLSTVSPSKVVIHPNEAIVELQRIQSIALSGASNSTGLFELNYRDERYLPFEGSGVDVRWEIELPKASNKFDFNTIVDAILTIDYTALSDSDYKQRIIEELGTESGGMVPISVRTYFPDTWYHFHNPIFNSESPIEPYSIFFTITRPMFPPNEEEHRLENVSLQFNINDLNIRIPLIIKYTSEDGRSVEIARSTGTDGTLLLPNTFNRLSPFGKWEITINQNRVPENLYARDEQGNLITVQYPNQDKEAPKLNTDIISNLVILLSYKAELNWPPQD